LSYKYLEIDRYVLIKRKYMSSIHTFNLEAIKPQSVCNGGTRGMANANNFPILKDMAIYTLHLEKEGVLEPHWHPNAAELDYVISGRARMTIFCPGDDIDTFEVGPGEIVFIPSAYFHYIENVSPNKDMQFAVFFNHERPEDIGISGVFGAYSNEVLGSVFGLEPKVLDSLPKYQEDLFVVARG
jgi:oxalate decarboxylase